MLPDKAIREMIRPSNGAHPAIYVAPNYVNSYPGISPEQVQPASLDVRLGEDFIDVRTGQFFSVDANGSLRILPGDCLLASLIERLDMRADNVAARVEGKSTWARKFLTVHSAGFIDPGFQGDITLELKNDGPLPIQLRAGVAIAQLSFHFLSAPAERLYGEPELKSHYQGQMGPTEARD